MSCFGGRMKEYERISLDRFDGKNLQSTVYFLSHLHEDHTVGLAEPLFCRRLKTNKNIHLYCSEVTEVLVCASKKYKHLSPFIKSIPVNTPTTIVIPDPLFEEKETVTITLLPAFHCPGSVMCLFEGHEGNVIYTGDYRWEHFDIEQMHYLRSGERVKKIKSLYMDTTFCCPNNLYIPSRQQCIEAVYHLVREWISQGPQYAVYIHLRAQYGHEPLINSLAVQLKKKIHVNENKASVYDCIQEFHNNFTSDGTDTQIHACDKNCTIDIDGERVPCRQQYDDNKVLVILPTTMYFTQFQHLTLDKVIRRINDKFYRACYSFHSSYVEIKDLLSYLRPDKVYPNVKPPSDVSLAETQHRLNTMLKECLAAGGGDEPEPEEVKVTRLGTLKTRSKGQGKKRKQTVASDTESLDFGTPRKKTKDQETAASEAIVSTRRSSRRLQQAATKENSDKQQNTPKKGSGGRKKSSSPDLFLSPVKSEKSDVSIHSSYAGSHQDSEIDLTQSLESQSSLTAETSKEDVIESSWSLGSFLSAVKSSSLEDSSCIVIEDDEEQTDEHFVDIPAVTDNVENDMDVKSDPDIEVVKYIDISFTKTDENSGVDEVDGKEVKIPKSKGKGAGKKKGKATGRTSKAKKSKALSMEAEEVKTESGYTDEPSVQHESFSSASANNIKESVKCDDEIKDDSFENAETFTECANETNPKYYSDLQVKAQDSQKHGQKMLTEGKPPICDNEVIALVSSTIDGQVRVETNKFDHCDEESETDPEIQVTTSSKVNIDLKTHQGPEVSDQTLEDVDQTGELKLSNYSDVNLKLARPVDDSHSIMEMNEKKSDSCVNENEDEDVIQDGGNNNVNTNVENDPNSVIHHRCEEGMDKTKLNDERASKGDNQEMKEACPIAETDLNVGVNDVKSERIDLCDENKDVSGNHNNLVLNEKDKFANKTKDRSVTMDILETDLSQPVELDSLSDDIGDAIAASINNEHNDISEAEYLDKKDQRTENDEKKTGSEKMTHPASKPMSESSKTEIGSSQAQASNDEEANSKDDKDSEGFWNYSSLMIGTKTAIKKQDEKDGSEKHQSPIKRMKFYRSRSFDMLNENEDNSEFCTKETPKEEDPPDSDIYFTKLAYCFENSESKVKKAKPDSENQNIETRKSEKDKHVEIVDDVIDLTWDDELTTTTSLSTTSMKFDANVGYKNEGGKKLMTISFSKSKLKGLKSKTSETKTAQKATENSIENELQEKTSKCDHEQEKEEPEMDNNIKSNVGDSDIVKSKTTEKDNEDKRVAEGDDIIDETFEQNTFSGIDEKELEDREELRRQAYGLMLETDSDSDSDSTVGPQSPSAKVLYDDYIELSSGDDDDTSKNRNNSEETDSRLDMSFTVQQNIADKNNVSDTQSENTIRGKVMDDEPTTRTITVTRVTVQKKVPAKEATASTNTCESGSLPGIVSTAKDNAGTDKRRKSFEGETEIYIDDDDADDVEDRSRDTGWLSARKSRHDRRRSRSSSDEDYDYDYKRRVRNRKNNRKRKERVKRRKAEKAEQAERVNFLSSTPDLFQRYRKSINVNIQPGSSKDKTTETSSTNAQFYWNYNQGTQQTSVSSVTCPSFSHPYPYSIPSVPTANISAQSVVTYPSFTAVPTPSFVPPPIGVPPPAVVPTPLAVPPPIGVPPPTGVPPSTGVPPLSGVPPPSIIPTQAVGVSVTRKSRFSGGSPALSAISGSSHTATSSSTQNTYATSGFLKSITVGTSSASSIDSSAVQKAAVALSSMTKSTNSDISVFKNKIFEVTGLQSILDNVKKQTLETQTLQNQTIVPDPATIQQSSVIQEKEDLPTLIKKLDEVKKLLEATNEENKKSTSTKEEKPSYYEKSSYYCAERGHARREGRYDDSDYYDDRRRSRDGNYDRRDGSYDQYEEYSQYYEDKRARDRYDDDPYEGMPPPHPSDPYYEEWMEYFRDRRYRKEAPRSDHLRSDRYSRQPPQSFDGHASYAEARDDYDHPMSYRQRPPPFARYPEAPPLARPRERRSLTHSRDGPGFSGSQEDSDLSHSRVGDGNDPRQLAGSARPQRVRRLQPRFMGPASHSIRSRAPFATGQTRGGASSANLVGPPQKVRMLSRSGKVSVLDQPLPGASNRLQGTSRQDVSGHDYPVFLTGIQNPRQLPN